MKHSIAFVTCCMVLFLFADITSGVSEVIRSVGNFALPMPEGGDGENFGVSVSIGANFVAVGADLADSNGINSGAVYVFVVEDGQWIQNAKLLAGDGSAGDNFGRSVAASGNTILVGAPGDDDNGINSGSAYIFDRVGGTWIQQVKLAGEDCNAGDNFGAAVAIDGNYAVVGAKNHDANGYNSGCAYVFSRSGNSWNQQDKLLAADGSVGDLFGGAVSISGDQIAIGTIGDDDMGTNAGAVHVFSRLGDSWSQETKITASDGVEGDAFGISLDMKGNRMAVGACFSDDVGNNAGSVYVYEYDGVGNWSFQRKLLAPNGKAGDWFGAAVAINDKYVLGGAPYHDLYDMDNLGSVYVFEKEQEDSNYMTTLIPSDIAVWGSFGRSVSSDPQGFVLGAFTPLSAATVEYVDLSELMANPYSLYRNWATSKMTIMAGKSRYLSDSLSVSGLINSGYPLSFPASYIDVEIGNSETVIYSSRIYMSTGTIKKNVFEYKGMAPGLTQLKLDLNKRTINIATSEINLTGLDSPVYIDVGFDGIVYQTVAYDGEIVASVVTKDVINGKNQIPIILLKGYRNKLRVSKLRYKPGKEGFLDSLVVQGSIITTSDYSNLQKGNITLSFGDYNTTLPGGNLVADESKNIFRYKAKDSSSAIRAAVFNFDACKFTITIKDFNIGGKTEVVPFGLKFNGFDETVMTKP